GVGGGGGWGQPEAFVVVVDGDEGNGAAGCADAGDDGAEHVGEFGADDQQPVGVGFGRGDLQQGDELAGGRQPVLDEAVVGQFGEFLDPDAGGAQDFDGRPGPERAVLFGAQVAPLAGGQVVGPDAGGAAGGGAGQGLPGGGGDVAGAGIAGGVQQRGRAGMLLGGAADQHRQDREPFAGPGVHPRFTAPGDFSLDGLGGPDGAGRGPPCPPPGIFHRPLGQVEVEGPDRGQEFAVADPLGFDHGRAAVGQGDGRLFGSHPLLPRGGDLGAQVQAVDAGVVGFQVGPEHAEP